MRVAVKSMAYNDRLPFRSISCTCPSKNATFFSSLRTGFTILVRSRSPAATSCSIGVKRKKFSLLINVISTSARAAKLFFKFERRVKARESPANNYDSLFLAHHWPSDYGRGISLNARKRSAPVHKMQFGLFCYRRRRVPDLIEVLSAMTRFFTICRLYGCAHLSCSSQPGNQPIRFAGSRRSSGCTCPGRFSEMEGT